MTNQASTTAQASVEQGDVKSLQNQDAQTVFAIAIESATSGCVDWYHTRETAGHAFEEAKARFADCPGEEITFFELSVPPGLSNDDITDLVDDAMHEKQYRLLMRHETSQICHDLGTCPASVDDMIERLVDDPILERNQMLSHSK